MLIEDNKSFVKLLIRHFAGRRSKAGTMLIMVNKSFNIHVLSVNEYYMVSRLIKGKLKNEYRPTVNTMLCGEEQKHTLKQLFRKCILFLNLKLPTCSSLHQAYASSMDLLKNGQRIKKGSPFIPMKTAQWCRATSRRDLLPHLQGLGANHALVHDLSDAEIFSLSSIVTS